MSVLPTPLRTPMEMSAHQVWIRTKVSFGGNRTGSDCNFLDDGGSGFDRTDKIFVL